MISPCSPGAGDTEEEQVVTVVVVVRCVHLAKVPTVPVRMVMMVVVGHAHNVNIRRGEPDLAIHETEAGCCYRIGCMAAQEEYCDKLSRIDLNSQEMRGRIEFCLRIFPFFKILELPIERRFVDATIR
jgi:hypothetical protein